MSKVADRLSRHLSSAEKSLLQSPVTELADIMKALKGAADQWNQIGIQLHVPKTNLNSIRKDTGLSDPDKLGEVIDYWLNNSDKTPSWETLYDALEFVDQKELAQSLLSNLSKPTV